MNKHSFKSRFKYWFDNQMARGTRSMIKILALTTIIIIVLISLIIFLICRDEISLFESFWDGFATVINAWMPYSSDGSLGYLILTAIAAIVGLLLTSVLIGIISSFIEEKLMALRRGNSTILEKNHIVILGFTQGEYALINQLVLAADGKPRCIVVAEAMEKDEMEAEIKRNIQKPKNVRIICRNVDVCDPASLECCGISDSRVVVVNTDDDARTIHAILAVRKYLVDNKTERQIPVIGAVSDKKYILPKSAIEKKNIILINTADIIGRVIAHSATQVGLSRSLTEVFNFEGAEFYIDKFPKLTGKTFGEISDSSRGGVPIGIIRGKESILVPSIDTIFEKEDILLYFAVSKGSITFAEKCAVADEKNVKLINYSDGKVLILGSNDILPLVKAELPEDIDELEVAETVDIGNLETAIDGADHVILLSDAGIEPEEADMQSMMTLINLRDIRIRKNVDFNITAEMRSEKERDLIMQEDTTDFIVASDMKSMMLAQLAEEPCLYVVFSELLSNEGHEFFVMRACVENTADKTMTVGELRHHLLAQEHIMVGYIEKKDDALDIQLNPDENRKISIEGGVNVIVIGE